MEHYYSRDQKSPLDIKKIFQEINGQKFCFYTAPGIFSKDKVDTGTLLLAKNMSVLKNSRVLDIGCGIGVLGIVAAKIFGAQVAMSDINKRAVMLARKNAALNDIKAEILQGNLYEKIRQFNHDAILSNPPQSAGKKLCFELIEQSKNYLKISGSLQLVARNAKGGKTLSGKMKEVFGNVRVAARESGYFVYMSENI